MDSDIMTIEDVAEYLRVPAQTVSEWAEKGDIPCGRLGNIWRFKREEIVRWVDSRLASTAQREVFPPLFSETVLPRANVIVTAAAAKDELLRRMIDLLAASPMIKSRSELEEGIFHREQLMSTGIGMEIGIPHVRVGSVKDVVLAAALVHDGVMAYESLDSRPVRLVFMIVARKDQHEQHLKLLAQISGRLKVEHFRQALIACPDADAFHALLTRGGGVCG